MTYQIQFPAVGFPAINFGYVPDTTQRYALGTIVSAVDNFWGGGEFIYGKNNNGGALNTGQLCVFDSAFNFVQVPNSANQARAVAGAYQNFTSNLTFGWFQLSGQVILAAGASVAAGTPFGITAAGQVGASSAGKEIENAASSQPSTNTVVIAGGNTTNGSPILQVPKSDGWFPGVTLSGTGIPGATTVSAIDPSGRFVTMSNNATATGTASITGTYTNFIIAAAGRMFAQGRIT
jgi:hypothetical protein